MNAFIDLLYLDNDPFEVIQFDFLCMPSVVLSPKNMKESKKYILKYIHKLTHLGTSDKVNPEPPSLEPLFQTPLPWNLMSPLDSYDDVGMTYYS